MGSYIAGVIHVVRASGSVRLRFKGSNSVKKRKAAREACPDFFPDTASHPLSSIMPAAACSYYSLIYKVQATTVIAFHQIKRGSIIGKKCTLRELLYFFYNRASIFV